MKFLFLALLILGHYPCHFCFAQTSVEPILDMNHATTYHIFSGFHYALESRFLNHWKGTAMTANFQFDSSAEYVTNNPVNQSATNKLFGFTDCNQVDPQNNSARFGWSWDPVTRRINIIAYRDYNHVHAPQIIGTTVPGEVSQGTIALENGNYVFYYKENRIEMKRNCSKQPMKGYLLYPYFGGQEHANHLIAIRLNRLK
jgi:hypothetical protein